jgi:hypothetical protein
LRGKTALRARARESVGQLSHLRRADALEDVRLLAQAGQRGRRRGKLDADQSSALVDA